MTAFGVTVTALALLGVAAAILLFEKKRAQRIESDLADQARRQRPPRPDARDDRDDRSGDTG